jgi:hypothetical protein
MARLRDRERAELRPDVEQSRRLIFGGARPDVAQDSHFSPAVAQRTANPFREIRRNPGVAGDLLEYFLEAFERRPLVEHCISACVCIRGFHVEGILHQRFPALTWRLPGGAAASALTLAFNPMTRFDV